MRIFCSVRWVDITNFHVALERWNRGVRIGQWKVPGAGGKWEDVGK
jgi:hypothetical protein